jgi:chromate transporter
MAYASKVAVLSKLFAGFTPAVAAVIVSVVHRMAKGVLKGQCEVILTILAALALLVAPRTMRLYVTFGIVTSFGLAGYALFRRRNVCPPVYQARLPRARLLVPLTVLGLLVVAFLAHPPLAPRGLAQLALTFSGLSLLLFGGGYVFIPMMQDVVVTNYGWLTTQQFLDGVALSQVTPGPILVIATFIAQKVMMEQYGMLLGLLGAVVGTVSIFTPPAVLMITTSMVLDSLKQAPGVQAALRGIRCGVLGMIVIAVFVVIYTSLPSWPDSLSAQTITNYLSALWPTGLIFVAALVALVKYNLDLVWIIPTAGILGLLLY